jgi:hypothetical protein
MMLMMGMMMVAIIIPTSLWMARNRRKYNPGLALAKEIQEAKGTCGGSHAR